MIQFIYSTVLSPADLLRSDISISIRTEKAGSWVHPYHRPPPSTERPVSMLTFPCISIPGSDRPHLCLHTPAITSMTVPCRLWHGRCDNTCPRADRDIQTAVRGVGTGVQRTHTHQKPCPLLGATHLHTWHCTIVCLLTTFLLPVLNFCLLVMFWLFQNIINLRERRVWGVWLHSRQFTCHQNHDLLLPEPFLFPKPPNHDAECHSQTLSIPTTSCCWENYVCDCMDEVQLTSWNFLPCSIII